MSQYVVIVYKEVGKEPEYRKIENSIKSFENLLGGEITTIHFEDVEIVYKKDSNNLRPNIYIIPDFLSIGLSIRGNLFLINKNEKSIFTTLTKEHAIKWKEILIRKSFHYENFDEYGRYISKMNENPKYHRRKLQSDSLSNNKGKLILETTIDETDTTLNKADSDYNEVDLEEVLKMILGMQSIILKFIKSITG